MYLHIYTYTYSNHGYYRCYYRLQILLQILLESFSRILRNAMQRHEVWSNHNLVADDQQVIFYHRK